MVVSTCEARATRSGSSFHPSSREKAAHRSSNDFTWRFGGRVFLLGFLKGLYIVFFIGGFTSFFIVSFLSEVFHLSFKTQRSSNDFTWKFCGRVFVGVFIEGFYIVFLLEVFISFFFIGGFYVAFFIVFFIGAFSFEFQDLVLLQRLHLEVLANISGGFVGFG